ncbi:hypothetical protein A2Z00_03280 [Candidatus Gottesmanbacteria bacterium RBG_13_45_10]|uniref:Bacterial toxin RNase RnlA/LsoA DBD domain-containing protein n=1 Tax=Candidatus Gottesmanbacteria bacterium RBG_13_45_10 TaxID=1798370 RepID=A0A1F5ZHP0_9BACT|nr:MAG: hypothetical protein A2Z00_03280 [Candidatus Gottesmanbacteria bacterium RBG_13_45_10]
MIVVGSRLWHYLSPAQQALAKDGEILLNDAHIHQNLGLTDYSYLVFPYAKLYEGFLKRLFSDLSIISEREYRSDHFRIGKVLSPNIARRLGARSAYAQLENRYGKDLAMRLWKAWKGGRNLVFHYFPHNYRALSKEQATELIQQLVDAMTSAVTETRVNPKRRDVD